MLFKVPFETPFHHPPVHHFWPQAKQTKIPFLAEGQKNVLAEGQQKSFFGRRPKKPSAEGRRTSAFGLRPASGLRPSAFAYFPKSFA
jgi:hypothetical protein